MNSATESLIARDRSRVRALVHTCVVQSHCTSVFGKSSDLSRACSCPEVHVDREMSAHPPAKALCLNVRQLEPNYTRAEKFKAFWKPHQARSFSHDADGRSSGHDPSPIPQTDLSSRQTDAILESQGGAYALREVTKSISTRDTYMLSQRPWAVSTSLAAKERRPSPAPSLTSNLPLHLITDKIKVLQHNRRRLTVSDNTPLEV